MTDQGTDHPIPNPEADGEQAKAAPQPKAYVDPTILAEEATELKNKLLRALADMENLRKRTEREVGDARQYAIAAFARDVLAVADNMHRALETLSPELRAAEDTKSFIDGVEITERELLKILEKNGVKKFEPAGEKFNPNLHQAMFEMPDADVPPGHVAQVMQAGFMIGERVLRPALVGVAKAAAKPDAGAPLSDTADTGN